jgi:hypothetical protein
MFSSIHLVGEYCSKSGMSRYTVAEAADILGFSEV